MRSIRQASARPALAGVLGAAFALGCRSLMPEPTPCRSDADCKLQRICDLGSCTWAPGTGPQAPTAKAGAAPLTPPAAAGPTATNEAAGARGGVANGAGSVQAVAMYRGGPEHRGRSLFKLPKRRPSVTWAFSTGGPVTSSPALIAEPINGVDPGVLIGSHDGRVFLLDAQGRARWTFSTSDLVWSSPALSAGDARGPVVYVGSDDDHLYAIDARTGQQRWKARIGACRESRGVGPEASRCDVDAGPTLGGDGTIYTGGDGIYAFRPDGSLRWRYPTSGHVSSAPALLADGTVVAGSQDNLIYGIGPDGSKRWDFRTGGDVEGAPAVAEDGTVYVGSDDGKVYALSSAGTLRWAFTTSGDVRAAVALGHDGTIYVGSFDGQLYAIRPDGTLSWTFRSGDRIVSSALVDAEGAILFGSQDDRLYALEVDGRPRWSVELGGDIDSSPVLAKDGTIYVGCDDRKVYAVGDTPARVSQPIPPATPPHRHLRLAHP